MEYLELFKAVLASLIAGGGFAVMTALSKVKKGETFELAKMYKTAFLGGAVGVVMYFTGQELTPENYQGYLAANGFIVVVVDKIWSIVRNTYLARKI